MKKPTRLMHLSAFVLALILALPIQALAGKSEVKERREVRPGQPEYREGGKHEEEYEYEYEYEYENGSEHVHEHTKGKAPAIPGARVGGTAAPAPVSAKLSAPADAKLSAPVTSELTAAVQALSADPGSAQASDTVRRLLEAAGPGAPRLWVQGRPVPATLLAGGDRVLLPLRLVVERLGAQFTQDAAGTITLVRGARRVQLSPGRAGILVNGSSVPLDVAPTQSGGATYVSLTALAEALVLQVLYDPVSGIVLVNDVEIRG